LLLADQELREALGTNGGRYVRAHFAWPHVVEQYEAFLAAL